MRVLAFLLLVVVGCTATETGNPAVVPTLDPTAFADVEVLVAPPPVEDGTAVQIAGGPASVDPAEGSVWIWDLQLSSPPSVASVGENGEFAATVPARVGDVIRMQARIGDGWSEVLDMRVADGFALEPAQNAECIVVTPAEGFVRFGRATSVGLQNNCDETVERGTTILRTDDAGYAIEESGELSVAPGESTAVTVAHLGSEGDEDILLVELLTPYAETRAVNLGGHAR